MLPYVEKPLCIWEIICMISSNMQPLSYTIIWPRGPTDTVRIWWNLLIFTIMPWSGDGTIICRIWWSNSDPVCMGSKLERLKTTEVHTNVVAVAFKRFSVKWYHCILIITLDKASIRLLILRWLLPGGRLNKKDGLTRYGDSHVKDKTS